MMEIYLDGQTILSSVAVATALGTVLLWLFKCHNWFLEQGKQRQDIEALRKRHEADMRESNEERQLICYCLAACLDGLEQLGANHTVPIAKEKIEKHLNAKAHTYKKEEER